MRRSILLAVLSVLVGSGVAAAQGAAPFPGAVELSPGQWVPCSHPLAIAARRGCGQPTPAPVPPPATPTIAGAPDCDPRPNPYTEPARAAACTAWEVEHAARPVLPVFEVGIVYRDGYDALRMVVLSVTPSLEGVPVVTAQYVRGPVGGVFSFRVTEGRPWERVQ